MIFFRFNQGINTATGQYYKGGKQAKKQTHNELLKYWLG
jgi:hypothetical protein